MGTVGPTALSSAANTIRGASIVAAAVLLAACNASSDNVLAPGVSTYALKVQQMNICSGYGCIYSDKFAFTEADAVRLEQIMQQGADNASAERVAVAEAIGVMEEITLSRIRFGRDVEKAYQRNLSRRGQMDCVDESLNTTAYLKYLYKNGWLRHHKPRKHYAERGLLIDGRYPHKSAVMISTDGTRWTVDSWYKAGGQPAQVMRLKDWRKVRDSFNPRV